MYKKLVNSFFTADFYVFLLSDKAIVRQGYTGLASYFFREKVREYSGKPQKDPAALFKQIGKTITTKTSDRWYLGLPLKYFTLVSFTLPAAAADSLNEAVRYALMRHVSYDLDQAYINYHSLQRDNYLYISALIAPKEAIGPYLKAAESAGITLHTVFPSIVYWARLMGDGVYISQDLNYGESLVQWDNRIVMQNWGEIRQDDETSFLEETGRLLANVSALPSNLYTWQLSQKVEDVETGLGQEFKNREKLKLGNGDFLAGKKQMEGYAINLLPEAILKQQKILNYMVLGGLIFFILSLSIFPLSKLAGQKRYLTKLEHRIETFSAQAEELRRLREESNALMTSIETMAEMKNAYPSAINIFRELTDVMPETAWLTSMNYADRQLTIQGEADSATAVIEAVENSPFFREVRFSRPVSKSGAKDRFTLVAEVVL